jgi:hypothetical protein
MKSHEIPIKSYRLPWQDSADLEREKTRNEMTRALEEERTERLRMDEELRAEHLRHLAEMSSSES